ncbi:NAD P-binding protein [Gloeophyllum trabeum ATCC 11539]|uniref:NAD P-binding protein n=1 Tax=Gloeophyllum trabeum (strain ATCC 11539 / FP-39264 / Madison 617) TaxID=670483 RepID=S7PSA2_GLOTA|nr:NAD P-binding protein [Gloeophyllum trabeum ATCC 11539]EPQ50278.1 NAD P-binding protein [Gloeophyllum trabeum ATCC 11539]
MPSYVVTGAARGIGFGFLKKLSEDPNNTVFGLVRKLSTSTDAKELASKRPNVHILQADIVDDKALAAAAEEVAKVTGGSLDVLINNAGVQDLGYLNADIDGFPNFETLKKDLFATLEVNVYGVMITILTFIPLLKKSSIKKVVTLSSAMCDLDFINGTGMTTSVSYSISKGAVNVAMAKFAAKFKDDGIIFLSICPGLTSTGATSAESLTPEEWAVIKKQIACAQKLYPHFQQPHSVEYSIDKQLEVINSWTLDKSGGYVSHKGNKEWL